MTNSVKVQAADRRAWLLKNLNEDARFLSELIDQTMKPYAQELGDAPMQAALAEATYQLTRVQLWAEGWQLTDGLELRRREPARKSR